MLNMRCAWKKVVALVGVDAIFLRKKSDVASLSDRVAAKVNNTRWRNFKQFGDNVSVQSGTRRVDNDNVVRGDEVDSFFAGGEDGAGIGAPKGGDVALHLSDSELVDFNKRDVIAANSQPDCADASVEVDH